MHTDFERIDFPGGTISPSIEDARRAAAGGWAGRSTAWSRDRSWGWSFRRPINPGPLAARITFFAPVSLLFFFTVMVMLGVLRGHSMHPVNYFFLAAAFFAFHLLLAYLVDHVNIHASFAIAAAVSVFLVVSYLRLVAGWRLATLEAGVAHVVFLVLFSYAFFFEGYTGLTVTVGAVITLFVLMQMTGRVKWDEPLPGLPPATARPVGARSPRAGARRAPAASRPCRCHARGPSRKEARPSAGGRARSSRGRSRRASPREGRAGTRSGRS